MNQLELASIAMDELKKHPSRAEFVKQWKGHKFESSSGPTPEFDLFFTQFRNVMKKELKKDYEFLSISQGHFTLSGFVRDAQTGNIAYFNISDVRYFQDQWHQSVLIRSAKSMTDFTGGRNHYTSFDQINEGLKYITS